MILKLRISLESEGIFSSGFSVPGGDDINVYTDDLGFPYFKGTSFKGLLRLSMTNLLSWKGEAKADSILSDLFGEESFAPINGNRRLKFTDFLLENKTSTFSQRAFTQIEQGMAKEGSLRTAQVITKGCIFVGQVHCDKKDVSLVKEAISGIKWIGKQKSRGFGKVSISLSEEKEKKVQIKLQQTHIISYQIRTLSPVIMTKLSDSRKNSYGSATTILGSALRGFVLSTLAQEEKEFFQTHQEDLLGSGTRFLNTVPYDETQCFLPSIQGFYENKDGSGLESIMVTGAFEAGKKRANLGEFLSLADHTITSHSNKKSSVNRIHLGEEKNLFTTTSLGKDQVFQGYILLEKPELAPKIGEILEKECFIGADKFEGFGHCEFSQVKGISHLPYGEQYGFSDTDNPETSFYLLALSPFTMINALGECCGLDLIALAQKLGVGEVNIPYSSTGAGEYSHFNRQWKTRGNILSCYESGSVFKLECDTAPNLSALLSLQNEGLGIWKEQGFGQILFLKPDFFQNLQKKDGKQEEKDLPEQVRFRRNKITWVRENSANIKNMGSSASQMGEIQRALETKEKTKVLSFLQSMTLEGNEKRESQYLKLSKFIESFLEADTLAQFGSNEEIFKLDTLIELFDYTRKKEGLGANG